MSDEKSWSEVDEYVGRLLAPHDEALEAALRASEEAEVTAKPIRVKRRTSIVPAQRSVQKIWPVKSSAPSRVAAAPA